MTDETNDKTPSGDGQNAPATPLAKKDTDPRTIQLSRGSEIDVSRLTQEQEQQLRMEAAKQAIAINAAAQRVGLGAQALDKSLETMSHHAKDVAKEEGLAITVTNTRDDDMGRTEVMIGNTETAFKGKLSRTQTGSRD